MIVCCIIVHFGSESITSTCLNSIEQSNTDNFKIKKIVVDNTKHNLGYAGGANWGIKRAVRNRNVEFILLLNNDISLRENTIINLLKAFKKKEIGLAGPQSLLAESSPYQFISEGFIDRKRFTAGHSVISRESTSNREIETDFISGSVMLIRKEVFDKTGYFDERFFMYYEDVDFCVRAKKEGIKCLFVPNSIVYHSESSSIDKRNKEYYMARNHLLFVEKHAPLRVKMREIARLPKTVYEYIERYNTGGKDALQGIKDYFLRRFGKRL